MKGEHGATGAKGDTGATGAKRDTGAAGTAGTAGTLPGAPGADASVTSRVTRASEVTTSSSSPVALDATDVTVEVPAGGAVLAVGANYDGKNANGANVSCVALYEASTAVPSGGFGCVTSTTYVRGHGAVVIAADAGSHTYTLRYQSPGSTLASFQNRTLVVSVLK